eukprot:CAMPEP_0173213780 /NCGR_PEP_ID=MMETSP1141-20130122/25592_1 /TAXON_ID=483371 /ORGANISM="non described non described, Strain CCMP2298" /LENGTH=159 /DNA_ID=CAMNT_0014141041 /DNA_START=212 /DNA_END=688 /DNA_ORIENTATION=-
MGPQAHLQEHAPLQHPHRDCPVRPGIARVIAVVSQEPHVPRRDRDYPAGFTVLRVEGHLVSRDTADSLAHSLRGINLALRHDHVPDLVVLPLHPIGEPIDQDQLSLSVKRGHHTLPGAYREPNTVRSQQVHAAKCDAEFHCEPPRLGALLECRGPAPDP